MELFLVPPLNRRFWILILFCWTPLCLASEENTLEEEPEIKQYQNQTNIGEVKASSKFVKVPQSLAKRIEQEYLEKYKLNHKDTQKTDVEILNEIGVTFLNFHVKFEQEKTLALAEDVLFELPRGGGVIDLARYVKGKVGSFNLKFLPQKEGKEELNVDNNFSVFYVSQSIARTLEGKKYGSGCSSYYDVTHFFKKTLKKGIQLNATDQRYLSVLAGSFHFIYNNGKKLKLATISFTDSRYPYLLCK